jgi:hypoxanthine-guanine phosphoribosyltransferase
MANTLFETGPAMNCFWKMDLGSSKHVKAVLIIGDVLDSGTSQTTLGDWKLTVGNNSDPLQNLTFFT